uniref:Pterin-4-alpha-carbinolamine dehydratase n=1 Tax=Oncorhynchus tshawytscha TaxID=74940 RepID=A0AAZ3R8K6_ONCTS
MDETAVLGGRRRGPKRSVASKIQGLSEEEMERLLPLLRNAQWVVVGRDAIYKEFIFKDFNQAFGFMSRVALQKQRKWTITLSGLMCTTSLLSSPPGPDRTHDWGGLSQRNITLATFIDQASVL